MPSEQAKTDSLGDELSQKVLKDKQKDSDSFPKFTSAEGVSSINTNLMTIEDHTDRYLPSVRDTSAPQ